MLTTFNNWQLSRKMLVAFAFIAALVMGTVATGLHVNSELQGISERHVQRGIGGTEALGRMLSKLREHRIIVFGQLNAQGEEALAKYDTRFAENKEQLATAVADYEPLAGDLEPQLTAVKAQIADVEEVNARIIAAKKSGGVEAALPIIQDEGKEKSQGAIKGVEELVSKHKQRAQENHEAGEAFAAKAFYFCLFVSVLTMAGLFVIWLLVGRTVAAPMAELSSVTKTLAAGGEAVVPSRDRGDELGEIANAVEMFRQAAIDRQTADARNADEQKTVTGSLAASLNAVSAGDLTANITADFPPAYQALKENFNHTLAQLREMIGSVTESAATIRTGSGEISQASEDLARRTEGNAASLEETSAALVQIDGRLKATATAAEQTVNRADQAIETVSGGRNMADEAVQAMSRVHESAKGIDSVIEGLDKIAFQTRVLAMNAAVEAGRAGDAGRGFAVVADLVSSLAMRAEEEAKRARDQLTVTQTDIVTAVDAVQRVDSALQNISGDVGEVHTLLGNMAADNQTQSAAISQISVAIAAMDQSTQQNAAMVEQTSAAARNLATEVTMLADQASRFSVSAPTSVAAKSSPTTQIRVPERPSRPSSSSVYKSPVRALPTRQPAELNGAGLDADWKDF